MNELGGWTLEDNDSGKIEKKLMQDPKAAVMKMLETHGMRTGTGTSKEDDMNNKQETRLPGKAQLN